MKICPKCNAKISDTAKFCRGCGFNVKEYEEKNKEKNKEIFCEECGSKIPSGSAFCEECGTKVSSEDFDFGALGAIEMAAKKQVEEQEEEERRKAELAKWEIGCNQTFGSYYQSNASAKEPIEWIVLAREGNKALLVSKYLLEAKPYNTTNANVTWETCTLRKWLNNEFLNTAFNGKEKEKIVEATIKNENNPKYRTNGGNDTKDKVFLLSINEANKYFKDDDARMCKPTASAISTGMFVYKSSDKYNGYGLWWLRSPGSIQVYAAYVDCEGGVNFIGRNVSDTYCGVRPALWINL